LRLFSFGCYGLALAALALAVFGAIECPTIDLSFGGDELWRLRRRRGAFWRCRMYSKLDYRVFVLSKDFVDFSIDNMVFL